MRTHLRSKPKCRSIIKIINIQRFISLSFIIVLFYSNIVTAAQETHFDFETSEGNGWNDCEGFNWYQDDPNSGHNSSCSLRSGVIDCVGVSAICRNVSGPSKISFWWKSDVLPQTGGQLSFLMDGNIIYVYSSTDWENRNYSIHDNKEHEIKWIFRKIKCYPRSKGVGRIDEISILEYYNESDLVQRNFSNITEYNIGGIKIPSSIETTSNGTISPTSIVITSSNISMNASNVIINYASSQPYSQDDNLYVTIDSNLSQSDPKSHNWTKIIEGLEDAQANKINKILIKNGHYEIDSILLINEPICIEGENKGCIFINSTKNNLGLGIRVLSNNCIIRNISLNGFELGIDVFESNNLIIENNTINTSCGMYVFGSSNSTIIGNIFDTKNDSLISKNIRSSSITKNIFFGLNGVSLLHGNDIILKENDFTNIKLAGLEIKQSRDIKIYHNNLRSCNNSWIIIDDNSSTQLDGNWWKECLSCDNQDTLLCNNTCKLNNGRNSIMEDLHPYCTAYGWRLKKLINDSDGSDFS